MWGGSGRRVYEAFGDFHAFFAPAFGRKQWREHSGHYLQALLVQSQERRNAEIWPRWCRSAPAISHRGALGWMVVIARLQEYLGPRLEHPLGTWVFDGSDFPKQGVNVGVTRRGRPGCFWPTWGRAGGPWWTSA